jgi:hypothetical protein
VERVDRAVVATEGPRREIEAIGVSDRLEDVELRVLDVFLRPVPVVKYLVQQALKSNGGMLTFPLRCFFLLFFP